MSQTMHIIHVNYDAGHTGGATIAAVRIHKALLGLGVASEFVSVLKNGNTPSQRVFPNDPWRCMLRRVSTLLYRAVGKVVLGRNYPVNILPTGMAAYINRLRPDIVHLHWIKADTISIEEIARIKAPIVWSLHDLWPCLGTDNHPQNEWFKIGYDKAGDSQWVDRWTWRRKLQAYHGRAVVPVGPSAWCAQQARESVIFRGHQVAHIPCPVDIDTFVPGDSRTARQTWNIPYGRFVVLFGANKGTKWFIKGFDRLVEAIQHVSHHVRQRMHIVVFGESSPTREVFGVPVQFVGAVQSAKEMATLYPAADIFAFPSRQETFGQTKSEALASGVPVVAFNETACAEGILHKDTGWVAAGGDVKAFAAGIDWAFAVTSDPSMRLRIATQARESVLKNYAPTVIAHQWTALYRKTLESVGRHSS